MPDKCEACGTVSESGTVKSRTLYSYFNAPERKKMCKTCYNRMGGRGLGDTSEGEPDHGGDSIFLDRYTSPSSKENFPYSARKKYNLGRDT